MPDPHPPELAQLLTASDPLTHDAAWAAFVTTHSRLLLYILEALRSDGYRRLRAYVTDGRGKFSTWLVVVARRLCLDFHRKRYGRARDAGTDRREMRAARRRLVDRSRDRATGARPGGGP